MHFVPLMNKLVFMCCRYMHNMYCMSVCGSIMVVFCSDMSDLFFWGVRLTAHWCLGVRRPRHDALFISTLRSSHDLNASIFWQFIHVFLFMTLSARILFKIQCSLRNLMKVASPTLPLDMQTMVLEWLKYVAVCPVEPARCFLV